MSETNDRSYERIDALKKLLEDDPRSLAFVTLAEEHNRVGQHAEAAAVANRGLLSHPDSVAGRLALAVAEAEQDNVREALEQIKRALLIDQENPKALALMGRILLKRGLAKRAVQFLSHAVKLAPKEAEYTELLAQARRAAKGDGGGEAALPVFSGDNVPDDSPWGEADESIDETATPESEHTVFDPDALKKLRNKDDKKALGEALANLPDGAGLDADAEPTAYHDRKTELPPPRRVQDGDAPDPREEPTAYGTPNPLKPKMGGSAAEYSQMMQKADADAVRAAAEARVAANPPASNAPATDDLIPSKVPSSKREPIRAPSQMMDLEAAMRAPEPSSAPPPEPKAATPAPPAPEPKAPSVKKAEPKAPSVKKEAPKEPSAKKPAPEPKPKEASAPKATPAHKQVGPASTRMVDDALWALFGQKDRADEKKEAPPRSDTPKASKPKAEDKPADDNPRKKPVRARVKGKDEAPERAPGQMVVRTSERFGVWTRVAIVSVLTIAAAFTGYAVVVSRAGPGPEVAQEELKGIASDLERGGLASLLAAEDHASTLVRSNPDLAPLLSGALAEIYATRWRWFGRNPTMRQKADEAIASAKSPRPSVELIAAMVELSTTTADRQSLVSALDTTLKQYPQSPKSWMLKGRIAKLEGRRTAALEALYRALSLHPQHRRTLLELARWYGEDGAHAAAFADFDRLQERYPLDVEAAIDRYVLGQITGADPSESTAVSTLAGLVRDEIPEVAKDEAGRAALAFAVPLFADGKLQEGIEKLGNAEAAFEDSAVFKSAVGGVLLALGEFDRARKQFNRALELEPNNVDHRIGLARAAYLERLDRRLDLVQEAKKIEKANDKTKARSAGVARLPYATVRMVFERFEIVEVEYDPRVFPEDAYRALAKSTRGAALQKALEAASTVAVADRRLAEKKYDEAIGMYEESLSLHQTAAAQFGLGRAHLEKGAKSAAVRHLNKGIEMDPDSITGRMDLARTYVARDATIDAIEVLEALEGQDTVVPEAMQLLGELRIKRGDYEGAVKPLEALVALKPKDAQAQIALGEVYARMGRGDDGVKAFTRAVEVDEGLTTNGRVENYNPLVLAYLGRVELDRKTKRGVKLLKKSLESEEAPIEAHFYLGRALTASRKTRKAGRRQLEKFVRLGPAGELRDEAERLLRKR
ncbi:MAG: tetratricopeptide repeat protein [Deltaproteobacteria bacterium]|jgi:tetratricopeptide (TPR) repeat protein